MTKSPNPPQPNEADFLPLEKKAWDALALAMTYFSQMPKTHPSQAQDFVNGIHACQNVLGHRLVQRQYPGTFATYWNKSGHWALVNPHHVKEMHELGVPPNSTSDYG